MMFFLLSRPRPIRELSLFLLILLTSISSLTGDEPSAEEKAVAAAKAAAEAKAAADAKAAAEERARRKLAVALNYCKASFHRITKYPNHTILHQEKRKILNNLDLTSVDEQVVVALYSNVIEEINEIELVDLEKDLIEEHHSHSFRQKLFLNAMAMSGQVATFNYMGALQTGVGSFWDFRTSEWNKDNDGWRLEKNHYLALTRKTTQFIETSWKLARDHKIPDEWLVRDIDLEQLGTTLSERDLHKRLRILKRMEPRMQCYPPYYYYVARTQQALGELSAAAQTYRDLRTLQTGHFRRDDMLAASLANLAAIEHSWHRSQALATARDALRESTDVWQANLVCASILAEHGEFTEAEDAVYRNLDVDLEQVSSHNSLALLYARSGQTAKLSKTLGNPEVVAMLKGPVLLQCGRALGSEGLPPLAARAMLASLHGHVQVGFGRDDLVVTADEDWQLDAAEVTVAYAGVDLGKPEMLKGKGVTRFRYRGILEIGTPWQLTGQTRPIQMNVKFPGETPIAFRLDPGGSQKAMLVAKSVSADRSHPGLKATGYLLTHIRNDRFAIAMDGSPVQHFGGDAPGRTMSANKPSPPFRPPQILPAARQTTPSTTAELPGPVQLLAPE